MLHPVVQVLKALPGLQGWEVAVVIRKGSESYAVGMTADAWRETVERFHTKTTEGKW